MAWFKTLTPEQKEKMRKDHIDQYYL